MKKIRIEVEDVQLTAELIESPTAEKIFNALPVEGMVNRWGDEIYFAIPVETVGEPDARAEVSVGEIGYWPPGTAFCIFFGPTPVSHNNQLRAASPVNVIGKVNEDPTVLKKVQSGATIQLMKSEAFG
jgi:hypothetical protein